MTCRNEAISRRRDEEAMLEIGTAMMMIMMTLMMMMIMGRGGVDEGEG